VIRLVDVYSVKRSPEFLLRLLSERPPQANISHGGKLPTMQEQRKFMFSRPYRAWLLVEHEGNGVWDGAYVGAVYCTNRNEVGVAILHVYQGCGYARAALEALMHQFKPLKAVPAFRPGYYVAHVAPGNEASHALFQALGGQVVASTYALRGENVQTQAA
jgi:RimJ/RimL family protein N-acetyltransferase